MLTPSLPLRLAKRFVRWQRGPTRAPDQLRREYHGREQPAFARIPATLRRSCHVHEQRVADRSVFVVTPKRATSGWHVLYTHGGAFVRAMRRAHWQMIEGIARSTGASLSVPIYPLAPNSDHRDTVALLEAVYRELVERVAPERIVLCGDSAGGNLALTQALRYRDAGLGLPARIVLFAPWLDLSMSNPELPSIEPRDVMLRAVELREFGRWWAGPLSPASPSLSPLFAELHSLPPIDTYLGTDDIFLPDAQLLTERVRAAGGQATLRTTPGGFHVFMGATFTREARAVFRCLGESLRRHEAGG